MRLKKFLVSVVLNLSLLSTVANADIFLHSDRLAGEDMCAGLAGLWKGNGSVSAKVLGINIKCEYYGNATVRETGLHTYSTDVLFELQSGSNLCPGKEAYTLPGTCDSNTGQITMKSNEADLTGHLENNGKQASLKGTVKIKVKNQTITANANSVVLTKQ